VSLPGRRRDQLLRGLEPRLRRHRDGEGVLEDLADVVERVDLIAHALHEIGRVGDRRRRTERDRVAVRGSRGQGVEADCSGGAVTVADHDLLAELLGERARHRAADDIDAAAGGERDDHVDRTRRPSLRLRTGREERELQGDGKPASPSHDVSSQHGGRPAL
jgi:hypothetical protein